MSRYNYRSGLERQVAHQLQKVGQPFTYEEEIIRFIWPERHARYTPDFLLPCGTFIETKGIFEVKDRQKHLLIRDQHPDADIRFVFSNSNARISKTSTTTYAVWCEKHGYQFADKFIPAEWLKE